MIATILSAFSRMKISLVQNLSLLSPTPPFSFASLRFPLTNRNRRRLITLDGIKGKYLLKSGEATAIHHNGDPIALTPDHSVTRSF